MKLRCKVLLFCLSLIVGAYACSLTKHIDQGQVLLTKVSIQLDSTALADKLRVSDLSPYISQKPNSKFLGYFNLPLAVYSLSKKHSNSWISRRLRAWGEAPIIYNEQESEYSVTNLSTALYNMGYLDAKTHLTVDTIAPQKVALRYHLELGHRYLIGRIEQSIKDDNLRNLLHPQDTLKAKKVFPSEQYRSFLGIGTALAPNLMQAERKRISQIYRNRGHWNFREEHIRFDIDTTAGYRQAGLRMRIDTTSLAYRIGRINVYYGVNEQGARRLQIDTIGGICYHNTQQHRLRPKFLDSRIWLRPKDLYAQAMNTRSYAALADLLPIRSISISQKRDSLQTEPTIDLDIDINAEPSKEFSTDLIGTHSGGNFGAIASLSFLHNNIFDGAEQLRLSSNIGYEELSSAQRDHLNYGVEASLRFPNLIIPTRDKFRRLKGTTDLSLSYNYLTRPEFRRNVFSAAWAYNWRDYNNSAFRYTFKLLEADYMHFAYLDERFLLTVPDYDRLLNYRNQLILSSSFIFRYNSAYDYRLASSPWLHSLRLHVQSAGNLPTAYARLGTLPRDRFGAYVILGANIVQFFRSELDYSGLYRLHGKNTLAYHLGLSLVAPYGNTRLLPIDLRYFSGGASSLRAWGARSLGPGSMSRAVGTTIFHQVGDIKLDLALELRLRLTPSWELALFSDAGNIWTIHKYREQVGGDFNFKRFYKEIAWSTGLGVRWDFDYFLLRLDAGVKCYDPQEEYGRHWVLGYKSIHDLIGIHFALGYPF